MRHRLLSTLLLSLASACAATSGNGDDTDTSAGDGKADGNGGGCTGIQVPGDSATLQGALDARPDIGAVEVQ
jgi:hypothetical protein